MLNSIARAAVSRVTDPIGRGLLRIGLSPDAVTMIGTAGVVGGAIGLFGTGHLFIGTLVITAFVFFDLFDGAMARAKGTGTTFGVVLDASCDRVADGAVFASLAYYAFVLAGDATLGVAALICLVAGQVISYVKARADSVGVKIGGALAERAERNLLSLVGAGLTGLGVALALPICLWVLAAASVVTVVQRLLQVKVAAAAAHGAASSAAGQGPVATEPQRPRPGAATPQGPASAEPRRPASADHRPSSVDGRRARGHAGHHHGRREASG